MNNCRTSPQKSFSLITFEKNMLETSNFAELNFSGLFHFLSVQGDGCKIPGLVKSMSFQRSTAKSPKIQGGWQNFHRN